MSVISRATVGMVLALSVACSSEKGGGVDVGEPDGASPSQEHDSGVSSDARVLADAGSSAVDAGPRSDGGSSAVDAGIVLDAATNGDAGYAIAPGLHVVMGSGGAAGHLVDGAGATVQLHGVDRSGTEFMCTSGSFFDGPADQPSLDTMKAWNVNAVRVPMNEDCWLGINGVPSASGGANYQSAIETWVKLITTNHMVAIVDLHWTAPGSTLANSQAPMSDADHSPTFWSEVGTMFKGNGLVIFDLFNEPFITDWGCWVSGGSCAESNGASYSVAGMASLLQAVRNSGADNVVMLGGLGYSSDMSQWVAKVNSIPTLAAPLNGISIANVAASWHSYDFGGQSGCPSQYNSYSASDTCNSAEVTATNASAPSVLAAGFPIVMGEIGISAYSTASAASFTTAQVTELETWFDGVLTWMESQGQSYLAWSWNTDTTPVLLSDYNGTASPGFGVTYQAHLKKF